MLEVRLKMNMLYLEPENDNLKKDFLKEFIITYYIRLRKNK